MEKTRRTVGEEMQFKTLSAKNRLWGTRMKQKDNGGLAQGGDSERGEKWSLSGFIFKLEPIGLLID